MDSRELILSRCDCTCRVRLLQVSPTRLTTELLNKWRRISQFTCICMKFGEDKNNLYELRFVNKKIR